MSNPNTADEALVTMLPMQRIHLVTASLGFGPRPHGGGCTHSIFIHTLVTFIHSPSMNLTIAGISVVRQRIVLLRISQKLPSTRSTTPFEPTRLRESSSLANPSLSGK